MRTRLLFFLHSLSIGGAERLVVQLADALAPQQYDIGICCLDSRGAMWEECRDKGYALFELSRQPGISYSTAGAAARVIRQFRPNIIHAHQYSPYFYAALGKVLALSSAKIILTEHGRHYPDTISPRRRRVNALLRHCAARITAVSDFSRHALAEKDGFPLSQIEVIYNGLYESAPETEDTTLLHRELQLASNIPLIGYVGSLREVKNPLYLLEAFTHISTEPQPHLVYIGDGPLRLSLETSTKALGLEKRVHFLGTRNPASPYFPCFTIFAMPSFSEAASLALLEAMARGIAVVATDRGGTPELIRNDHSGLLVPIDAPKVFAKQMEVVLNDPASRTRLGQAAQSEVSHRFAFQQMLDSYKRLYEELR